jgi:RimJ/RimL family protein N-acetyltransferase
VIAPLLAQITPGHYETLYRELTTAQGWADWRYRDRPPPGPDEFTPILWAGVLHQQLVVDPYAQAVIGIATAYGHDDRNATAQLSFVVFPSHRPSRLAAPAARQFIDALFERWPLRKLYLPVPQWCRERTPTIGSLATLEGTLVDHEYHGGRHQDLELYALHRPTERHATHTERTS